MDIDVPNVPEMSPGVARSVIHSPGVVSTIVKKKYIHKKCPHDQRKHDCRICSPEYFCIHNSNRYSCRKCGNPPRTGQNVCMMSAKKSAGFAQHTNSVCIPTRSTHAENAGIHPSKNPRVNTIDQRDTAKNAWVRLPLNIRKRFVTTTYRKIIAGFAPPTDFALITGAYTCVLYAWELEYVFTKG